jgi:hypothetical protein
LNHGGSGSRNADAIHLQQIVLPVESIRPNGPVIGLRVTTQEKLHRHRIATNEERPE